MNIATFRYLILISLFLSLFVPETGATATRKHRDNYSIGVYYFPGWKDDQDDLKYKKPWDPIKPFPDREPLLGWYDEGSIPVMKSQLGWMSSYGIKYVVFDWYYDYGKLNLHQALDAYLSVPQDKVKFSILWANHSKEPLTLKKWDSMVDIWISYMKDRRIHTIDGRPTIFIFSASAFRAQCASQNLSPQDLIARAEYKAKTAGIKSIYFIGGAYADDTIVKGGAKEMGFSAITAYNFTKGGDTTSAPGFESLSDIYQSEWEKYSKKSTLPVVIPMTSGWDRQPWGGSKIDGSIASPDQFARHIQSAKKYILTISPEHKEGIICCWNEFGEGSFIEPTKLHKFAYLRKIKLEFK